MTTALESLGLPVLMDIEASAEEEATALAARFGLPQASVLCHHSCGTDDAFEADQRCFRKVQTVLRHADSHRAQAAAAAAATDLAASHELVWH